jgi:hypothetical protein
MRLSVLAIAGVAALQTAQPGQMTQARVWIENHGRTEAVPVDIRDINLDKPMRVHIQNGDAGTEVLPVRTSRQQWEYEMAVVPAGRDVAAILNARGNAGWEAVGTTSATAENTMILMKRPR